MTRALAIGERVAGRYQIERPIGRGGIGAVYAARDLTLGRAVALKVLRSEYAAEEGLRERFEREARIMGRLRHPGCVAIHDFGEHDGLLFLVMDLLDGQPLRALLAAGGGPWPLRRILGLAVPLADALAAAHALPVVHRDVKPENVIVVADGARERPVLVDFGLAFIPDSESLGRVTEHGLVSGTPGYVSPEQARGGEIGPASDVYSLGCVIHELAAGGPPFRGLPVELVTQHLYVRAPSLRGLRPELPAAFAELVGDMLLKTAVDRPTAEEVRDRLADVEAGRSARARGAPRTRASRQIEAIAGAREEGGAAGRVVVVGAALPDALVTACGGAGLEIGDADADVTFAPDATPDEVRRLAAAGPVVAGARRGDLARALELLRAGAADVVELPLGAGDLTHKLRRAIATARRRKGGA